MVFSAVQRDTATRMWAEQKQPWSLDSFDLFENLFYYAQYLQAREGTL